jgi:hypothetical protein
MWWHAALVKTDDSEDHIAFIIRVTRMGMLQLLVTANISSLLILVALMMEAMCSSETMVLKRATWRHIPGDGILHSHCHENLKSYFVLFVSRLERSLWEIRMVASWRGYVWALNKSGTFWHSAQNMLHISKATHATFISLAYTANHNTTWPVPSRITIASNATNVSSN